MLLPNRRVAKPVHFRQPWDDHHPDFRALDRRLAPDHLARLIDRLVDGLDLDALLEAYTGSGPAPYPPAPLLKVALYLTQRGLPSPADWYRQARECEPVRWLARGLEPCRARWYAFRDRLAPLLLALNAQVLAEAVAQGLTQGERGAQDGTSVAANASRHRLLSPQALQQRLEQLRAACSADAEGRTVERPAWMARRRRRRHQLALYERAADRLEQRRKREQRKRACDRQEEERCRISIGDPEAVPGLDKLKVYRPLYNVQFLRDLDSPLLLAYGVFAQASDAGTLVPVRQRARAALGQAPPVQLGDAAYATGPHLAALEQEGATLYAPWPSGAAGAARRQAPAWLPKEAFVWLAAEEAYVCPRGQRLELAQVRQQQRAQGERVRVAEYRCAGSACAACPLAVWCTPNPAAGRTVSRSEHEGAFERLRERMAGAAGQELYQLRKQTVELSFAEAKEHRGLRRFSGRGLARAEAQVGLVVLAHNGLVLQRAGLAAA
jgi:transposase